MALGSPAKSGEQTGKVLTGTLVIAIRSACGSFAMFRALITVTDNAVLATT